jgi:hypothetical protein
MTNQSSGWWSSVGCESFGDETCGDVKTSDDNVRGHIVRGRNVRGRIVPVPADRLPGELFRLLKILHLYSVIFVYYPTGFYNPKYT